ncbi:hypothetical protein HPB50_018113 [Hyalomma asiaticum]|uniref:Uncharacterized protein n=1 Tax=Hyalomma asiaticum TaxID=266040 RepID=A0ACB7RXL2_HYAAI|nr:hypothetical protein HPB50_018113 [Hyalomma asiaticum]
MADQPDAAFAGVPGLQQPPNFDFNHPSAWSTWIEQFEDYAYATGMHRATDEVQMASSSNPPAQNAKPEDHRSPVAPPLAVEAASSVPQPSPLDGEQPPAKSAVSPAPSVHSVEDGKEPAAATTGAAAEGESNTESAEHMFYVANRMFLQSNCPLLATFRSHIEAKYMTTAQNVDFESPEQTYVRAINEWCSNATNGKVPAVVTRKTFTASSSMVLVSAVYFKGLWKDKFYPNATHMMKFYVSRADTLDVRMMTRTGRFPYAEVPSLRIRALEVPYRTGKLSMVLVLPTEVDGLRLTQQSLLAGDTLWEVTKQLRPRANVRLGLPKFVLTARNKMRDLLEGLGSHRPFDPEQAQFINISGFKGLHTTEIIQAVTVEVSEDGNEITRASALVTEVVAKMAPATQFLVDRPFLFFVRSTTTGAILLFGCVRQPLEWRPDSPDNSALL